MKNSLKSIFFMILICKKNHYVMLRFSSSIVCNFFLRFSKNFKIKLDIYIFYHFYYCFDILGGVGLLLPLCRWIGWWYVLGGGKGWPPNTPGVPPTHFFLKSEELGWRGVGGNTSPQHPGCIKFIFGNILLKFISNLHFLNFLLLFYNKYV